MAGACPLVWSDELARYAEMWGTHLKNNNCEIEAVPENMRGIYLNGDTYGQNIAKFERVNDSMGNSSVIVTDNSSPYNTVTGWFNECKNINPDNLRDTSKGPIGHYTQLVWKDTKRVGCAKVTCQTDNSHSSIYVCNYDPSGNIINGEGDPLLFYNNNVTKACQ